MATSLRRCKITNATQNKKKKKKTDLNRNETGKNKYKNQEIKVCAVHGELASKLCESWFRVGRTQVNGSEHQHHFISLMQRAYIHFSRCEVRNAIFFIVTAGAAAAALFPYFRCRRRHKCLAHLNVCRAIVVHRALHECASRIFCALR